MIVELDAVLNVCWSLY